MKIGKKANFLTGLLAGFISLLLLSVTLIFE